MKLPFLILYISLNALAMAKPHLHVHRRIRRVGKRDATPNRIVYAPLTIETAVVFVLNDQIIPEEEVHQGIANGTLVVGENGNPLAPVAVPAAATTLPSLTEDSYSSPKSGNDNQETTFCDYQTATQQPTYSTPPPSQSKEAPLSAEPSRPLYDFSDPHASLVDENGHCATCERHFPNGKIPCSEFPYGYGAVPLPNEGMGGWSGIQDPLYRGSDGFDDIDTVPKNSCDNGSCCSPGSFCSYGCPSPYLKLSFPETQGRAGQTVGGLYCNNQGFLEVANGALGTTLCGQSSKSMTVKVQNTLSKSVSICRTDYPGDESMTFPLTISPGETAFLANPDASKYFLWEGKRTSAHYYVNKQGVLENEACTWGARMQGKGNWAPTILGTSFDDVTMHTGFSSLKQNELAIEECLGYDITFTGDGVMAPCRYNSSTTQYCQGTECWTDKSRGCTASTKEGGTLIIILSDS